MGENRNALYNKKKALKRELSKPKREQNKYKIIRLQDSIRRHKLIAKDIKGIKNRKSKRR